MSETAGGMDYEAVFAAAMKLDVDERTLLAWELWKGIEEEVSHQEISEELKQELKRRLAAHEAHPEEANPWEEVRASILEKLSEREADTPHVRSSTEDA